MWRGCARPMTTDDDSNNNEISSTHAVWFTHSLSSSSFLFFFVSPFIASTNITLAVNSHWRWWWWSSSSFVYAVRARLSLWSSFDDDDALCIYMMTKEWTKWNIKKNENRIYFANVSTKDTKRSVSVSLFLVQWLCACEYDASTAQSAGKTMKCEEAILLAANTRRSLWRTGRRVVYDDEVWRENTCVDEFMCIIPLAAAASHRRFVMCFFIGKAEFLSLALNDWIVQSKWININEREEHIAPMSLYCTKYVPFGGARTFQYRQIGRSDTLTPHFQLISFLPLSLLVSLSGSCTQRINTVSIAF